MAHRLLLLFGKLIAGGGGSGGGGGTAKLDFSQAGNSMYVLLLFYP